MLRRYSDSQVDEQVCSPRPLCAAVKANKFAVATVSPKRARLRFLRTHLKIAISPLASPKGQLDADGVTGNSPRATRGELTRFIAGSPARAAFLRCFDGMTFLHQTHVVLIHEMPEVKFLFTTHRRDVRFCLFEIRFVHDSMLWRDKATPVFCRSTPILSGRRLAA